MTDQGQTWHKFLSLATFPYNIFHPHPTWEIILHMTLCSGEDQRYYSIKQIWTSKFLVLTRTIAPLLTKRLNYLQNMLQNFKMKHLALLNKDREYFQYNSGDLVYLFSLWQLSWEHHLGRLLLIMLVLSNLQNCRSTQLFAHDYRWDLVERLFEHER